MANESTVKSDVRSYVSSEDPLCQDAIKSLIAHKEEDLHVDYKESFNPNEEKQWHGITTDVMAFANTMGGYLVFGVRDGDFCVVGLDESVVTAVSNTNMVMQKLNRYVSPPFSQIRTKCHQIDSGATIVIMYVPESKGTTHIFVKDVSYKYPSGKTTLLATAGMIFIRRSATNHVMEPEDLEFIINRRIEHYKDSILDKIAKVVHAPPDHQMLIFDPEAKGHGDKSYFISDSPDAVPVKGLSFTVAPKTNTEEVCGWISLLGRDPGFRPRDDRIWHIYSEREDLVLTAEQRLHMVRFSIFGEAPVFYWLKSLPASQIKPALLLIIKQTRNRSIRAEVLKVGAFLGKTFFGALLRGLGEGKPTLRQSLRQFPIDPVEGYCGPMGSHDDDKGRNTESLRLLAAALSKGQGGVIEKLRARALDCRLYARDDKYVGE